jgi:hypothetical protein
MMRTDRFMLLFLLSLALASCGPSQRMVEVSPTMAPQATNPVSIGSVEATAALVPGGTTTVANSTVVATDAWKTYHNTEAGYNAAYPVDWSSNESAGVNGEFVTTFTAPIAGQGIVVSIQNGETAVEEITDMPNTRCQPVTISGFSGRRCFDTLASSISTTFIAQGRQYTIATFGKHSDQNIYQHLLESLTMTP